MNERKRHYLAHLSKSVFGLILASLLAANPGTAQEKSVRPGINDPFKDPDLERFIGVFEGESREIFAQRNEIVSACKLKPGMVIADVGAGTGLFTKLFSDAVGPNGIKNVETVLGTDVSANLPENSVDMVFICDTYHHFEFPERMLQSIRKALKPEGQIVLIDFHRIEGKSKQWTLDHVRAGQEVFTGEVREAGFEQVEDNALLKENYFVRFKKS
jgi:predicted methyltransferase